MAATPAHWSAVDRGPRTDAERHAEIVRLNDELDVAQAQGLKTKTVSGMIRTARDGGHLMIRGRYARKTGTRMIRRHPRAAA